MPFWRERTPGTLWVASSVGFKPGLDASEKRKVSYLSGIGPRFLGRPVSTLFTMLTELSRLPYDFVASSSRCGFNSGKRADCPLQSGWFIGCACGLLLMAAEFPTRHSLSTWVIGLQDHFRRSAYCTSRRVFHFIPLLWPEKALCSPSISRLPNV
jgi:hypothetical protein